MARVVRTSQSLEELLEIWDYIARDNVVAADNLVRKFDEAIQRIAENPDLGIKQLHHSANVRCKPVARHYLVFYDTIPDGVRILRILHGARNWEFLL